MEQFFQSHQYTFAALSALSTFLAVVVALYLARQNEKVRLIANASVWMEVTPNNRTGNYPRTIQVSVTNIGTRTTWLPYMFFSWVFPFDKTHGAAQPQAQQPFPIELRGGRNVLIRLSDYDIFRTELMRVSEHLKWFRQLRLHYCQAYIYTEDGKRFRVKIAPALRKEFKQLQIS